MIKRLPIVGVMGSRDKEYPELSVPVGQIIARSGAHLLTGGGQGVMKSVSQAYCAIPYPERRGLCLGICPTEANEAGLFNLRNGYPNEYVEIPIITPLPISYADKPDALSRNHVNILTSSVVIALPGGPGTANEIALAVKFGKPIIVYDPQEINGALPSKAPRVRTLDEVADFIALHPIHH